MSIGNYSNPENKEAYLKRRLDSAKEKIIEFPIINEIVDNFNYIYPKDWIDNPLVFISADANYDLLYKAPNLMALNYLKEIEESLSLMDVFNLPTRKRSYICSRLKENKSEQVLSVISEIQLLSYFIKKLGRKNVEIEPIFSSGKKPELKLNWNNNEIYVEQTNVDLGLTERKLKEIFTKASEQVWGLVNDNIIVTFHIDTAKLVWDGNGHLSVEDSVNKIVNSIKYLNLSIFFNIEQTTFRLESLSKLTPPNKFIIESKDILHYYDEIGSLLSKNIDKEPFKTFCEKTKIQEIIDSPIVSFFSWPAYYKLIEMASHDIYPSPSSIAQKEGFIHRVIRNIEQKIKDSQREPNKPNLLFIKAKHWTTYGYSTDKDPSIADIEFQPIFIKIEEFLRTNKVDDLNAIILYEDIPLKSRIILNKQAKTPQLSLEDIKKLID